MKNKLGFTIAELLVVMAIIGVLTAIGINAFLTYDKGVKYLLSNTYYSLDRAVFNATLQVQETGGWENYKTKNEDGTTRNNVFGTVDATSAARTLCQGIAHYITPVEGNQACTNGINISLTGNEAQFSNTPPMFTAINGVRFWMTTRQETTINGTKVRYFVIFADLNSDRGPNSLRYQKGTGKNKSTKDPDIFAFVAYAPMNTDVTDVKGIGDSDARVVPIGISEVEPRYLTARYTYINQNIGEDEEDEEDEVLYSPQSASLAAIRKKVWGGNYTPDVNVPLSLKGTNFILENSDNNKIGIFQGGENDSSYQNLLRAENDFGANIENAKKTDGSNAETCGEENNPTPRDVGDNCGVFIDKYLH